MGTLQHHTHKHTSTHTRALLTRTNTTTTITTTTFTATGQPATMTMLKGIPRVLNPRLLHVLASMGHGDELVGVVCIAYMERIACMSSRPFHPMDQQQQKKQVLADANFPAAAIAHHTPGGLVNCDGASFSSNYASLDVI